MRKPKLVCWCEAYAFPHRWQEDYCSADCPDARGIPQRDVGEPSGITMPGRSHFDSIEDYTAARAQR